MIGVIYPTLRLEPTEFGSRIALYWVIRGWTHQSDGWLHAIAQVHRLRSVPTAMRVVRGMRAVQNVAQLEEHMRATPGVRVTRFGSHGWTEDGR